MQPGETRRDAITGARPRLLRGRAEYARAARFVETFKRPPAIRTRALATLPGSHSVTVTTFTLVGVVSAEM
jgi:hypothetical protein